MGRIPSLRVLRFQRGLCGGTIEFYEKPDKGDIREAGVILSRSADAEFFTGT
jgi:hypothetical protein